MTHEVARPRPHRTVRHVLLVGVLGLVAGSCTRHMVGPARTTDDFERKAYTTAEAALSSVETVALVAQTAAEGNTFQPYAIVSVADQEDALAEVRSDFASIQPPHPANDELRARMIDVLDTAVAHVAAVRLAIRRGQFDTVGAVAAPLDGDATALRALMEQL